MELENLKALYYANLKDNKGKFTSIVYKSVKDNGYYKITKSVVRIVNYANIKGVNPTGKVNPNQQTIIENLCYYNTNTKNYLVKFETTKTPSTSKYYDNNNQEISKEQWLTDTNTIVKPYKETPIFSLKLENLIAIKF